MESSGKYCQPELTSESVMKKLEGSSPLQASKVLIDMELHDQQSSLEVMNQIYQDFENKENLIEELIEPCLASIGDGLITFARKVAPIPKSVSAGNIIKDVKNFDYNKGAYGYYSSIVSKDKLKDFGFSEDYRGDYTGRRGVYEDTEKMKAYKDKRTDDLGKTINELEVDNKLSHKKAARNQTAETDHIQSLGELHEKNKWNLFIEDSDLNEIANSDDNFAIINGSLNASKGSNKQFADIVDEKKKLRSLASPTNKQKNRLKELEGWLPHSSEQKAIALDKKAREKNKAKIDEKTKDKALEIGAELGGDALGKIVSHATTIFFKSLSFELIDIFKNGLKNQFEHGYSNLKAIITRLKRVMKITLNAFKEFSFSQLFEKMENLAQVLLNSALKMLKGFFKALVKVIVQGFSAITQAVKVLMQPASQMSKAQKADAILKILASATVTFIGIYFQETFLKGLEALGLGDLSDIVLMVLTGIVSVLVVWGLDKLDIFSVKDEMRSKRVNEVFDFRIQQIKENTDAFETASIEKLAKDKLQFRSITEKMSKAIDSKSNVNDSVYDMADFMKIDLKIKSTDDFMDLLKQGSLAI